MNRKNSGITGIPKLDNIYSYAYFVCYINTYISIVIISFAMIHENIASRRCFFGTIYIELTDASSHFHILMCYSLRKDQIIDFGKRLILNIKRVMLV